jgi:flagellar hook-associated protein 3 FlgL
MRVTDASIREAWLQALATTQARLARTQNQVSTGLRFSRPAEDPVGAVQVLDLNRTLAQSSQYSRNADLAANRLGLEETTLARVGDVLQRVRELAVEANNATETNETRASIATEVRQALESLVQLANTQDASGNYLFSGYSSQTQAFTLQGGAVVYNGDQGQRQLQIGDTRFVADSDNGAAVFQTILNGNGTFTASAAPGNTGTGLLGDRSVVDPAQYDGGSYTISFPAATTFEVRDASNALVTSGAFTPGQAIAFRGLSVEIDNQPAAGDSFAVTPSANQDLFTTLGNFIGALTTTTSTPASQIDVNNRIGGFLVDIDQGINRMLDVRAQVGSRLSAIDSQKDVNADLDLQNKSLLSQVQDLDYADALSRLSLDLTSLESSEKAFAQTAGLSLFNYL